MEPSAPQSLPKYLREGLEKQDADTLRDAASWIVELADAKEKEAEREAQRKRADESVEEEKLDDLEDRDISTDPGDWEDIPTKNAYITTKEIDGRLYYYWQWRSGSNSWENKYIAPVNPAD